jgi:uncharacterized oligopeptide transporter (OPT) family protein
MDFLQQILEKASYLSRHYQEIGALVLLILLIFSKKHRQIKTEWLAKFVGLMVLVMFVKLAFLSLGKAGYKDLFGLKYSSFLFVGLEDAFFVVIPYYISKFFNKKPITALTWIFFSFLFASGHMYQGGLAASVTFLYPYFISRYYAEKTSFLNVMICHFVYDCFVLLTIQLHNLGVLI